MSEKAALTIKGLNVDFPGTSVIRNLELSVPENKTTCIIGETGSGKSVLLSAILRILPATASVSGEIFFDGKDLLTLSEKEMRNILGRTIAYIPQGVGDGMNPMLRVGGQISEGLVAHKMLERREAYEKGISQMEKFGIDESAKVARKFPHMLSGGMVQRALIAMGIIMDAPVILADEPTKGLDSSRIEIVRNSFKQLTGKTILCVTHDLLFAKDTADYICVLYSGEIVEYASSKDFFSNPLHPYSKMMIDALPSNGLRVYSGFAPPHAEEIKKACSFFDRCPFAEEKCVHHTSTVSLGTRKVKCRLYDDQVK